MNLAQVYSISVSHNFVVLSCLLKDNIFAFFAVFDGRVIVLLHIWVGYFRFELIIIIKKRHYLFVNLWEILKLMYLLSSFTSRG